MTQLLQELRRRKVLPTTALYVVAAWIALQVADVAFPGLGVPEEAIRHVWIAALAGLPLAIGFAWRYQIQSGGIVRTGPIERGDDATLPLATADHLILGTMALVAAGVLVSSWSDIRSLPSLEGRFDVEMPPNAIAVLPLRNVTGDPEQEHLVAAMHDALITNLSRIRALTVKSRSSADVYRNVVQPVRQTGMELGVGRIVEGSVFRTEDRVQINVQLIDARTDENLWSESYERALEDVITLQREVARAIAERVEVEITPDEESRLAAERPVNPEVYETYARGMFHLNQYTPDGTARGLEYLRAAVELDPDDPLAHAGLALGYTLIAHSANPAPGVFALASDAAARALALDPLFAEAHAAMAEIQLYFEWDWAGAERSFRRALQLNPNLEFAHAHYAWYLQLVGDEDGAMEHMTRARQLAPVTPIFTAWLGWLHWSYGRFDDAIAEAQASLELNPAFPWGLYVLGGAYASKGRYAEAVAIHERLLEILPNVGRWGLARDYALMGRDDDARRVLAELAEDPGQKDLVGLGLGYVALGDLATALDWIEAAWEARVDWFPWVAARVPAGDFGSSREALRGEPRFQALIERLALPETD